MRHQILSVLMFLFLLGSTNYSANTVFSEPLSTFLISQEPFSSDIVPQPSVMTAQALSPHGDPTGRILENLPPCGPTQNIHKVCYAIRKNVKSVTQALKIDAGLTLTQPVTISALLGGYCPERIAQTYNSLIGNYLFHNDCEGNGKARTAFADITLTEPNPAGGVYTYTITGIDNVVPLYNVALSKLTFLSEGACDRNIPFPIPIESQEIHFGWWSPDGIWREPPSISLPPDSAHDFPEFRWAVQELSQAAIENFRMPAMGFWEYDLIGSGSVGAVPPYVPRSVEPMIVPHKSGDIIYIKMTDVLGDSKCTASAWYKMDSVLLTCHNYPDCGPLPGYHHE